MHQDLKDLKDAIESQEVQALIPKDERFNLSSLSSLTDMISAKSKIKLERGFNWAYDPQKKVLTYDEAMLLNLPPEAAPGLIFHNVGHSLNSVPKKYSLSSYKDDVAKATNNMIAPEAVYDLIESAEDERMEHILTKDYENLRNSYLPRIDRGWREESWKEQKDTLDKVTAPGEMVQTVLPGGQAIQESAYYKRVATAIRGLVSGTLTQKDLPHDMPWNQGFCDMISDLKKCQSVDELLEKMRQIIQSIAKQRMEPPPPPPCGGGQGEDEGEEGEEGEEGGGQGHGNGKCGGSKCKNKKSHDGGAAASQGDAQSEAQKQKQSQQSQGQGYGQGQGNKGQTSFVNSGGGAGFSTDPWKKPEWQGPPWSVVAGTTLAMTSQIRSACRRYLKDNENSDKVFGFKTGKLAGNKMAKAYINKTQTVFTKYEETGERNYAIYLMVDVSGSMASADKGIINFPELDSYLTRQMESSARQISENPNLSEAEKKRDIDATMAYWKGRNTSGNRGERWKFACRLAVALADTLRRFKELQVAMGSYHSGAQTTKPLKSPFTPERMQAIMNDYADPRGGTTAGVGLKEAHRELKKSRAEKKLIIFITDGDFGDYGGHLKKHIEEMRKENIETVVLTVGLPADTAAASVGPENADQVTDENIGKVLGKHLKRMVR